MLGRRSVTFLLILSIVSSTFYLPSFTPRAQAFLGFGDFTIDVKAFLREVVDGIAMTLAQRMIDDMVRSTVNWAQTGFEGNPAYVTNPKQYFTDIADGVAGEFIEGSNLRFLCSPFQTQIRLALQRQYIQPYQFQCTLTGVVGNIDAFYNDFSQGGWDGWFTMTQNSANNPYGAYLEAKVELDSRIARALDLEKDQLNWNQGFLSWSDCLEWEILEGPTPDGEPLKGQCLKRGPAQTPGSVIKSQLDKVLPSGLEKLTVANHVEQLVSAFANGLLTRYVFGPRGLFASGSGSNTGSNTGSSNTDIDSRSGKIDIDNDNVPDGQDADQDGKLESTTDICYHGGTPPNCTGSASVTTSPYFTPICQAINGATITLTDFTKFIDAHADQMEGGASLSGQIIGGILAGPVGAIFGGFFGSGSVDNFKDKADAGLWANRASEVDSAVGEVLSNIQGYRSSYFDDIEIATNRFSVYVNKIVESLIKDEDLDLSVFGSGGGGLENLMKQSAYNLRYFAEVKTRFGKCESPNIRNIDGIPLPPGAEEPTPPPPPPPGEGGAGVITTSPTSTWTPPQTANGWWPSLSPDGRYVAYGNWGESWVTDLNSSTKQTWNFSRPSDLPSGARCIAGQWLSNTRLTFICDSIPGTTGFWRYEVTVGEWVARKTSDNPNNVESNIFRAKDGHWASYLANGFRLARDNQIVATGIGGALSISGNQTVHACTNSNASICVRDGSILSRTYTPQVSLFDTATNNGYIVYGGYGPVRGITPAGADINLRLSSSLNEGVGTIVFVNNAPWVVTTGWNPHGSGAYIFLRPWGSLSTIAVTAHAVSVSVAVSGNNFVIAYNSDVGRLTVITIPTNASLSPVTIVAPPSPPPPPPPGPPPSNGFTFFGQTKFLVLAGYFDGLDAPSPSTDLDYLKSKGIDGIRVFPNWWDNLSPSLIPDSDPLITSDGSLNQSKLNKLISVVDSANSRGMVVDVSFAREVVDGNCDDASLNPGVLCKEEFKQGVVAVATALRSKTNVFYDLSNEHDHPGINFPQADVLDLKRRIENAIGTSQVLSVSSGDPNGLTAVGIANGYPMDIVNAHFASGQELDSNVSTALTAGKSTYIGEPNNTKSVSNYSAQDFIGAVVNAKRVGIAAWTFHTNAGFYLDGASLQSRFEDASDYDVETGFLNSFKSAVDAATWGGGGGGPPPPPGGQPASLLSAVQAERAKYPASFTSLCNNSGGLQPTSCPLGYMLNTIAWNNRSAGWGLSRKSGGNRCPSPAGEIACDILHHQPTNNLYDVFGASEITADPQWTNVGPPQSPDRVWVAPRQP